MNRRTRLLLWTMPRTLSGFESSTTTSRVWPELTHLRSASSTASSEFTVTTAGIGVITSRASCSWRWKTPPSITASPGSRLPPFAELWMISLRSAEVCFSDRSCGLTPNRRTTVFETKLRPIVNGALATSNQCSGRASTRAARSAFVIASIFGTCSPIVMCSEVVIR
jgi:hypothetical protein